MSESRTGGNELRACPFCGESIRLQTRYEAGFHSVRCHFCGVDGPRGTEQHARLAWNRRATPDSDPSPKETTCPHCMTDLRVRWDERGEIVSVLALGDPSGDVPASEQAIIDGLRFPCGCVVTPTRHVKSCGAEGHGEWWDCGDCSTTRYCGRVQKCAAPVPATEGETSV